MQEERKGTAVKEDDVLDNTMMKVLNSLLMLLLFTFESFVGLRELSQNGIGDLSEVGSEAAKKYR